jgi:hypothetical protein
MRLSLPRPVLPHIKYEQLKITTCFLINTTCIMQYAKIEGDPQIVVFAIERVNYQGSKTIM